LYSTAILNPTKCSKKPAVTKNSPTMTAAVNTVRVVMEMVLTLPVGPDSHINCMSHPEEKPFKRTGIVILCS
jgi:hypothetical protein